MGRKCDSGELAMYFRTSQQLVLNELISWICCPFAKMGAATIYQFPQLFLSLSDISLLLQDHRTRN